MRHLLLLSLLSLAGAVQAGGAAAPATALRVTTGDIAAPGFSLRASLKARGCHGDVRATPLSLTGELLSVNVKGTLCGRDYTFMEASRWLEKPYRSSVNCSVSAQWSAP